MSYTKNTWVDQDVERPKTYEVTNNQDGSITLTDSFGLVQELGTPVNAVNMNHIEDGIDGCAIRKHNLTETFALGEWVLGGSGDDEGIYKSLVADNVGNAVTDSNSWEKVKMGGASGRNVGEIISSTLPLTDAGLHLLDGSLLQYGIYKEFIDYIAELHTSNPNANYFCTETEWQTSVTTYGSCGKFVYDSVNNTVRLPKLGNQLIHNIPSTLGVKGNGMTLGLQGKIRDSDTSLSNFGLSDGGSDLIARTVAYGTLVGTSHGAGDDPANNYGLGVTTDPTKSGIVAETNNINTADVYYYVVIATSTKTQIQVDIDKIATDLNGKAGTDLANVTDSAKVMMAGMGMPSNRYIDLTLGASGTQYTAPANGWFNIGKDGRGAAEWIDIENQTSKYYISGQGEMTNRLVMPVQKGDVVLITYSLSGTTKFFRFIYAQGSKN